jgi:DNA transposition AAA+ family ATPase
MNNHPPTFLVTKEYRRFAEFCDACRRDAYIGVCHGAPGVGKTLSARHYARWDEVEPVVLRWQTSLEPDVPPDLAGCRAVVYTPTMMTTPRRLTDALTTLCRVFDAVVAAAARPDDDAVLPPTPPRVVELLIVDEADRLKEPTLEQLRDLYDRTNQQRRMGLVLIGLPGIEKRLARYAQLYSRVGFVHHYRPLSEDELRFILAHKWREVGLAFSPDDYTDAEALAAIARITGGNFRLVQRLFAQIARILEINALNAITKEVVEAAREGLVIGPLA